MIIVYIVISMIIIISIVLIILFSYYNSFQDYIIRLNEAESNIDKVLRKRFDLLSKSVKIIRKYIKTEEEILKYISKSRSKKMNIFELDSALKQSLEEFNQYGENNEDLKNNKEYTKIELGLIESDSEIIALKKYYDDIALKYNDLIDKFPASVVAKFKKYNSKDYFNKNTIHENE